MTRPVFVEIKQPRFVPKKPQKPERFVITPEVLKACPYKEVTATFRTMVKLGVARLPFLHLVIEFTPQAEADWGNQILEGDEEGYVAEVHSYFRVQYEYKNEIFLRANLITKNYSSVDKETLKQLKLLYEKTQEDIDLTIMEGRSSREQYPVEAQLLIVLLATRGIVKERTHSKLAKLGIGKDRFEYTTVLRLPAAAYHGKTDGRPTGRHMPFHLRRGHARWQWTPKNGDFVCVGPGADDYERVTQGTGTHTPIFIEPAFVNADDDFVSARREYKLTSPVQAA